MKQGQTDFSCWFFERAIQTEGFGESCDKDTMYTLVMLIENLQGWGQSSFPTTIVGSDNC